MKHPFRRILAILFTLALTIGTVSMPYNAWAQDAGGAGDAGVPGTVDDNDSGGSETGGADSDSGGAGEDDSGSDGGYGGYDSDSDYDSYGDYGWDSEGEYDSDGFDSDGYDENGYDENGYDENGYDENGYDENGYDVDGYDEVGLDIDGFDEFGYDDLGMTLADYAELGIDIDDGAPYGGPAGAKGSAPNHEGYKAASDPIPGNTTLNSANKPQEGWGEFGSPRGNRGTHTGIDVQAEKGTPVVAIDDGVVVDIKPNPSTSYGNQVVIDLDKSGYFAQYSHLDTTTVEPGQRVEAGQQVGTVGRTGNTPSSGDSHLHFEIRDGGPEPRSQGGTVIDPTSVLPGDYQYNPKN